MSDHSSIEWTDATWNPITGCTLVSEGCRNCYAARLAATRLKHMPSRAGLARLNAEGVAKFTGEVRFNREWLTLPLGWKKPRRIFVCAHGDLFAEGVPDAWIDQVFAVMALAPQHTFQVLTKRPKRMREYLVSLTNTGALPKGLSFPLVWPLPNVWLGTSIEDQAHADERVPELLATPAAVRFVSAEPLLGPIDLRRWMFDWGCEQCGYGGHQTKDHCPNCGWVGEAAEDPMSENVPCPDCGARLSDYYACPECDATNYDGFGPTLSGDRRGYIDWVIAGGESGPGARPMHPDWAGSLRDQCVAAGVPFFFKQWGEWTPGVNVDRQRGYAETAHYFGDEWSFGRENLARDAGHIDDEPDLYRVGKGPAGRLLDGVEHNGMPARAAA